jgi:hypothetical protein
MMPIVPVMIPVQMSRVAPAESFGNMSVNKPRNSVAESAA